MALPLGIETFTGTTGPWADFQGNEIGAVTVSLTPIVPALNGVAVEVVHQPSGRVLLPRPITFTTSADGGAASITAPVVDATGLNVTNFSYRLSVSFPRGTQADSVPDRVLQITKAQALAAGGPIDLDLLADVPVIDGTAITTLAVTSVAGLHGDITADALSAAGVGGTDAGQLTTGTLSNARLSSVPKSALSSSVQTSLAAADVAEPAAHASVTYAPLASVSNIPKAALSTAVQNSLAKADSAAQTGSTVTFTNNNDGTGTFIVTTTTATPALIRTLVGNSGSAIAGVTADLAATWMSRGTWTDLANGNYLSANTGYVAWLNANLSKAADIGVPLVPHDSGVAIDTLLDQGISGAHDADYTSMGAKLAQNTPLTCYARVYWEMNMAPIPADQITRSKFIACWNRAIPLIRAGFAGAARTGQTLKIVFCPLTDGRDPSTFYPASANVDLVGIDAYGQKYGTTNPTSSELLTYVSGQLESFRQFAASVNKPVSIGEWGNWQAGPADGSTGSRGRGDFPEYIDLMFDWAIANNAVYMSYFNIAGGGITFDLSGTPNSLARYQARANAIQGVTGADTTAPTAPSNLAAGTATTTTIPLTWTASTDAVGVVGYRAYSGGTQIGGTLTGTSATLTSLTPGTTYVLTLKAFDAAGNLSAASNSISVTTTGSVTAHPLATFDTTVQGWASEGNATVAWTASPSHTASGSLAVTAVAAGEAKVGTFTDFAVTPGQQIVVSAWVRPSIDRTCYVELVWGNSSHQFLSNNPTGFAYSPAGTWTLQTGTLTAPAGAAFARPRVGGQALAAGEVMYVDDVTATY